MAKNLFQLLIRPKAELQTPLVLQEEEKAEALLVDDAQDTPGAPLQALAAAINRASVELGQLDETRRSLESLRGPIAEEFENRVADSSRLAQVTSELRTTKSRLAETARANGEAVLARTREASAEMELRAEGALSRLEQATAENIGLERTISELKVVTAGEQERAAELTTQLAVARAESRLASETMREQAEASRTEIKDLKAKLEEAGSRTKRVQKLHNELSEGQAAALDEKSKMQRDLTSVQSENRQMAQRVEVLDNWLTDWRRRPSGRRGPRRTAADLAGSERRRRQARGSHRRAEEQRAAGSLPRPRSRAEPHAGRDRRAEEPGVAEQGRDQDDAQRPAQAVRRKAQRTCPRGGLGAALFFCVHGWAHGGGMSQPPSKT